MIPSVTRAQFQEAILAGALHAEGLLEPPHVARLTNVGLTATRFDCNFAPAGHEGILNCGCPASQANLPGPPSGDVSSARDALWQFAQGFDDRLHDLTERPEGEDIFTDARVSDGVIQVTG